ncbi:MAG: hypothetical protein WC373_16885 [Smithella sp.]|jgi:hypothetical protein
MDNGEVIEILRKNMTKNQGNTGIRGRGRQLAAFILAKQALDNDSKRKEQIEKYKKLIPYQSDSTYLKEWIGILEKCEADNG